MPSGFKSESLSDINRNLHDISTIEIDYWYEAIARDYRLHAWLPNQHLQIDAGRQTQIKRYLEEKMGRGAFLPDFTSQGLDLLGLRSIKADGGTVIAVYRDLSGQPLTLGIVKARNKSNNARLLMHLDINLMTWTDWGFHSVLVGWQSPATLDRLMGAIWPPHKPHFDVSEQPRVLAPFGLSQS